MKLWPMDWWRIGAVFFLGCFIVSVLFFLMLQRTYEQTKDIVYRQQTEIIDEQARIIRQQDQALRDLIADNTTAPLPRVPPVY